MSKAPELKLRSDADKVEEMEFEPIQGYPMLHWRGKRPYRSTRYYPAQLKETYGQAVKGPDGKPWLNRIYWGDNREVMSHLLREFRGKVDLVYIDPPFDSKAEYKKNINLKGKGAISDHSAFEEKQYTDIWTNDEYLQFMYERLMLIRELMSNVSSLYVHCDQRVSAFLKLILDEIFGVTGFKGWITWKSSPGHSDHKFFGNMQNHILYYTKNDSPIWNQQFLPYDDDYLRTHYQKKDEFGRCFEDDNLTAYGLSGGGYEYTWKSHKKLWRCPIETMQRLESENRIYYTRNGVARFKRYLDEMPGNPISDLWIDIARLNSQAEEKEAYPTQKPEALLERIVTASSNPGSIVFDCFMGSATTQAVAMKMGRRFIGADINLGAIHTTVKRLNKIIEENRSNNKLIDNTPSKFSGFQVYHVNNYEIFKNPIEAKSLLVEALELDSYPLGHLYDGQKDGRQYKIMPVNHIASKADLNELVAGFDQRLFAKIQAEAPNKPVEKITLVCMGHEPDLAAHLKNQTAFLLDVEVVDILRDRQDLEFKRDSVAKVKVKKGELVIEKFYPQNLLQKLSLPEKDIEDWRQLVETIAIDWNYTGEVMNPAVFDSPGKNELVKGRYKIPGDAGRIRLKITDLISESLEMDVDNGQD